MQERSTTMMAGKSAIMIAQHLSTVRKADKFRVLDEGRVVEEGSPTELAQKALFQRYWEDQQFN